MSYSEFIQILAACFGFVGSLFFAIGVVRQSTETMSGLVEGFIICNPNLIPVLAAQKADYIFGAGFMCIAFFMQFSSFFLSKKPWVFISTISCFPFWTALFTVVVFIVVNLLSKLVSKEFEKNIRSQLKIKGIDLDA